jgi:hypothetical protein
VLLQRAIVRNMMKTGGSAFVPPADDRPRIAAGAQLILDEATAAGVAGGGESRRLLWRHGIAHALAGLVFAAVSTVLFLRFGDMELLPLRTAVVLWAHAWPTVLIHSTRCRRVIVARGLVPP